MPEIPVSIASPDVDLTELTSHPSSFDSEDASFYERLLDNLYDGVYFVDPERRITYWNRGAENLTGYAKTEAVGRHCFDNFLVHVDSQGQLLCMSGCPLTSTLQDGKRRECQIFLRHRHGHRVPVSVRVAPIRDSHGEITGAVEIFSDVTAQLKTNRRAAEFERLAFTDPLTRAHNRRFMALKVKQAILEITELDRRFGLLAIDVDYFKKINDVYGHDVGDRVLKALIKTLRACLRPSDVLARWGGDEFLVLLSDATEVTIKEIADRCCKFVAAASVPDGSRFIEVTVSIGATLLRSRDTLEAALKRADSLMYQSKENGHSCATCG
ncbi:MAG TPA: diguanylate cyclase [Alphaproteobacteria bacterium]|nr:diguanylate cyclase [Alphaproteobacteria bacterium]